MDSPKPAPMPVEPGYQPFTRVAIGEVSTMTRAVTATIRKHITTAPANRRKRRLLNRESAIRRSLVGAKGMR